MPQARTPVLETVNRFSICVILSESALHWSRTRRARHSLGILDFCKPPSLSHTTNHPFPSVHEEKIICFPTIFIPSHTHGKGSISSTQSLSLTSNPRSRLACINSVTAPIHLREPAHCDVSGREPVSSQAHLQNLGRLRPIDRESSAITYVNTLMPPPAPIERLTKFLQRDGTAPHYRPFGVRLRQIPASTQDDALH